MADIPRKGQLWISRRYRNSPNHDRVRIVELVAVNTETLVYRVLSDSNGSGPGTRPSAHVFREPFVHNYTLHQDVS